MQMELPHVVIIILVWFLLPESAEKISSGSFINLFPLMMFLRKARYHFNLVYNIVNPVVRYLYEVILLFFNLVASEGSINLSINFTVRSFQRPSFSKATFQDYLLSLI